MTPQNEKKKNKCWFLHSRELGFRLQAEGSLAVGRSQSTMLPSVFMWRCNFPNWLQAENEGEKKAKCSETWVSWRTVWQLDQPEFRKRTSQNSHLWEGRVERCSEWHHRVPDPTELCSGRFTSNGRSHFWVWSYPGGPQPWPAQQASSLRRLGMMSSYLDKCEIL